MTIYSYDANHHRFVEVKRTVWTLRTIGLVIGILLVAGLVNVRRSADHDIGSRFISPVSAENDLLREELSGLLDKLRVLEGQEKKLILRIESFDRGFQLSTQSSSDVEVSGLTMADISTALDARTVSTAGLSSHMSASHSR